MFAQTGTGRDLKSEKRRRGGPRLFDNPDDRRQRRAHSVYTNASPPAMLRSLEVCVETIQTAFDQRDSLPRHAQRQIDNLLPSLERLREAIETLQASLTSTHVVSTTAEAKRDERAAPHRHIFEPVLACLYDILTIEASNDFYISTSDWHPSAKKLTLFQLLFPSYHDIAAEVEFNDHAHPAFMRFKEEHKRLFKKISPERQYILKHQGRDVSTNLTIAKAIFLLTERVVHDQDDVDIARKTRRALLYFDLMLCGKKNRQGVSYYTLFYEQLSCIELPELPHAPMPELLRNKARLGQTSQLATGLGKTLLQVFEDSMGDVDDVSTHNWGLLDVIFVYENIESTLTSLETLLAFGINIEDLYRLQLHQHPKVLQTLFTAVNPDPPVEEGELTAFDMLTQADISFHEVVTIIHADCDRFKREIIPNLGEFVSYCDQEGDITLKDICREYLKLFDDKKRERSRYQYHLDRIDRQDQVTDAEEDAAASADVKAQPRSGTHDTGPVIPALNLGLLAAKKGAGEDDEDEEDLQAPRGEKPKANRATGP